MALITIPQLDRIAAQAWPVVKTATHKAAIAEVYLLKEATAPLDRRYDIFLSHSSLDALRVDALKSLVRELGYTVYVDWTEDDDLNRAQADPATADRLRTRIENSRALLVVDAGNLHVSKWVPWEIGYADGLRKPIGIIPIEHHDIETLNYHGQEYLGLYPYIDYARNKRGTERLWANQSAMNYATFDDWLNRPDLRSRSGPFPHHSS